MIRLVFLLRRQPNLSLADFHARWADDHGPLVASHQTHLGILRYTQSHRLDDPMNDALARARGGLEPAYDGVAELWFESEAAIAAAGRTDAGRRAGAELLADEAEFIDLPNSPLWLAYEYPQVNPSPEGTLARVKSPIVKLHYPLRHPAGMSLDEAQLYWRTSHGPLIRSMAPAVGMLRYQQVHRFETPVEAALRTARGHHGGALHRSRRSLVRPQPPRRQPGSGPVRAPGRRGRGPLHRLPPVGHLDRQGAPVRGPLVGVPDG